MEIQKKNINKIAKYKLEQEIYISANFTTKNVKTAFGIIYSRAYSHYDTISLELVQLKIIAK